MHAILIEDSELNMASVYFNIEAEPVLAIAGEMQSINPNAYMNGYNWEVFLCAYLEKHQPDLLQGLELDSEAGTFVGLYAHEELEKAQGFVFLIHGLIEDPDKIYSFLKEHGEEMEWD